MLKTERNKNDVYLIWDFLFLIFRIKLKHIWKKWRKLLKDEIKKETFWKQKKNAKRDKVNATKAIRYYPVSGSLHRSRFCLVTQRSPLGWQVVTLTFVLVRTINITISWHNSLIVFFGHHYLRHYLCSYLSIFLLLSPPCVTPTKTSFYINWAFSPLSTSSLWHLTLLNFSSPDNAVESAKARGITK